jgi:hypothetical protein
VAFLSPRQRGGGLFLFCLESGETLGRRLTVDYDS